MDLILLGFAISVLIAARFQKLDADYISSQNMLPVRGLMAIAIILHHMSEQTNSGLIFPFMRHMGYLIVAVFFFLSGYGLMVSFLVKAKSYLKGYWKKRILYILIVFLIADAIYSVYHLFLGDFTPSLTIAANSWYMVVQILLYIIFGVAFKIAGDRINLGIMLVGLFEVLLTVILVTLGKSGIWYMSNFAFLIGLIVAKERELVDSMLNKHYGLFVVASVLLFGVFSALPSLITVGGYNICRIISTAFFCCIVLAVCRKIKIQGAVWNWIGSISLEIYLYHGLVYMALGLFIYNDILWVICTLLITIPFAWFMTQINGAIKKRLLK